MKYFEHYASVFIIVINLVIQLEAVTVNPLAPMCPTNKVAPRRKRFDKSNSRTLGVFYNLLRPDSPSSLQEKPQLDDPNDCGEIEDYDENDISAVTPQSTRRQGQKYFAGGPYNLLNLHNFNNKPTRPPPAGYFGTNSYTPPKPQEPTDYLKPVHEGGQDPQMIYRPGLVGAPIGHVVGLPQKHGSRPPSDLTPVNRKNKLASYVHGHPSKASHINSNTNKHHRTRKFSGDASIIEQNPYLEALKKKSWESVQNYIEVRPGAFLFYWLYYADGVSYRSEQKPLIIWVQGGPGFAASGIANFAEIGPLTMNMQPRNHTWVHGRNLLLIDHPVGVGFSYALNKTLLVKTDKEAARDLLAAIKGFYKNHKEYRKTPAYIFGQSYGGKLCPRLGYYLHKAIQNKRLKMNFKGIGIGSGWVNPKLSLLVQPEYLYNMGMIDILTYTKARRIVKNITNFIEKKEYVPAERLDNVLFQLLNVEAAMHINFNNINQPNNNRALVDLSVKINKYVKPTLRVPQNIIWTFISEEAFQSLNESFLVPSNKFLETLLNHTQLKIAVFNGNLDVVTPLAGASNWVHDLKWHGAQEFMNATIAPIRTSKNGFFKAARQLSFWSVHGSGHWVPEDNPDAMEFILQYVIKD